MKLALGVVVTWAVAVATLASCSSSSGSGETPGTDGGARDGKAKDAGKASSSRSSGGRRDAGSTSASGSSSTGGVDAGADVGSSATSGSSSTRHRHADAGHDARVDGRSSSGTGSGLSSGTDAGSDAGGDGGSGTMTFCTEVWLDWDQSPIPNSQVDVSAGAPNLEAYADNGDGTVTDEVTGLEWQMTVSTQMYVQEDAASYCANLSLAGYRDWRLPSDAELFSLIDLGQSSGAINPSYFPNTPLQLFWTASVATGTPNVWGMDFDEGQQMAFAIDTLMYARCVRGGVVPTMTSCDTNAPSGHYTIGTGATAGVVLDNASGLYWQQAAATDFYSWADAQTVCATLDLDGAGWRLPTAKELFSLLDRSQPAAPYIDSTAFPDLSSGSFLSDEFWSATPQVSPLTDAGTPVFAWTIDFSQGGGLVDDGVAGGVVYVRCVR